MTDIIQIPLSDLLPWEGNVRKTDAQEGLEELMASIAAHGLLQPLVVKPATGKKKASKYHVVAVQRRLMALNGINYTHPIPCTVIPEDADATEISLVENTIRQYMHPIDQFHAFRQMQESGSSPADMSELSPTVLREHGLVAGLRWLSDYIKRHALTVSMRSTERDEVNVTQHQALLVFRSVGELDSATQSPVRTRL